MLNTQINDEHDFHFYVINVKKKTEKEKLTLCGFYYSQKKTAALKDHPHPNRC